jgi:hypothetical protein
MLNSAPTITIQLMLFVCRLLFLPAVVFHLVWYFLVSGQASNVPFPLGCLWAAITLIIVFGSVGPGVESAQALAGSSKPAPWNESADSAKSGKAQ